MPPEFSIRGRFVFPVDGALLEDGVVGVRAGRIVAVEQAQASGDCARGGVTDLGNVAILPGLVNAHTHLEFSHLAVPLGEAGNPLPEWIRRVIQARRGAVTSDDSTCDPVSAVEQGLRESLSAGVTCLGEIATAFSPGPFARGAPRATVFLESIAFPRGGVDEKMGLARRFLDPHSPQSAWRAGLSPHAPYTVHAELFLRLIELARERRAPVAMHLAESPEEIEFLRGGSGPFRRFLEEVGAWDASAIAPPLRPLDYLARLRHAPRSLIIHGNYLDDDEIALLAANSGNMSLVYCPRTHAYFAHSPYPLARLLSAGVNVALGTDSRASNPDLSLLDEMRFIALRGEVPLEQVLRMGTINGAKALGLEDHLGALRPGHQADLCVVALEDQHAADPHELPLLHDGEVVETYVGGVRCAANSP